MHQRPVDSFFNKGRKADAGLVQELIEEARAAAGDAAPWQMIAARPKLNKLLFEIAAGERRYIGKTARGERSTKVFATLRQLWDAGLRPPNRYTVTEPVVVVPARELVVVEKAPGAPLLER